MPDDDAATGKSRSNNADATLMMDGNGSRKRKQDDPARKGSGMMSQL